MFDLTLLAGLDGLWDTVRQDWFAPVFLGIVAVGALVLAAKRQWTGLISLVGIAVVAGVLLFGGEKLFGSENSGLTGTGIGLAGEINTSQVVTE